MIPRMIAAFQKKHPHINIEIFENNTDILLEKLSIGALDIVIDNAIINDDRIKATVFSSERLLLAVPDSFPVNKALLPFMLKSADIKAGKHITGNFDVAMENFKKEPFILLNAGNDTGERAEAILKKHGIAPKVKLYVDQQLTAFNIAASGMGVSFVSDTLINHLNTEPPLCFYRLSDPESERNIFFYVKKNHYLSKACQRFIEVAGETE